MPQSQIIEIAYFVAAILFILGLKLLSSPVSARRGMHLAELGMAIAIGGTLLDHHIITYTWIIVGAAIGGVAGVIIAVWTPMTAMPQRTALSHAFGAAAAALVGISHYYGEGAHLPHALDGRARHRGAARQPDLHRQPGGFRQAAGLAARRAHDLPRAERLQPAPACGHRHRDGLGHRRPDGGPASSTPWSAARCCSASSSCSPSARPTCRWSSPCSTPTPGLAGAATGFALDNKILIIAGTLDGASGLILSILMCKAMNRSITNVLFGAFGKAPEAGARRRRPRAACAR